MSDSSVVNNVSTSSSVSSPLSNSGHEVMPPSHKEHEALLATHPWLRFYEEGVPAHIEVPDLPLTWLLDQTASNHPGQVALIYYGARMTYAQLSSYANRFAVGLQRLGVRKGDRVAIALPNIPQYPIAFYGALRAGAVVVPTNPLYTEREMQHQLSDCDAKVLIMLDSFYPVVRAIRSETPLEHIIITSPADFLPPLLHTLYPLSHGREKHLEPALSEKELHEDKTLHVMHSMLEHTKGSVELFNLPISSGNELAVLQYTGGTTGIAKGAMLTHRNLLANALQTRHWTPGVREAGEITLCVTPFFHAYGMTVGMNLSIYCAATMVLLPRFKAKEVVDTIHKYHPSLLPGIPTMYLAIMREVGKHAEYLSSIKYCISGAAPLPAKVRADFEALSGGRLVEGYGLSEASPVTHCNPLNDDNRSGSIGIPIPDVEATIVHPQTGEALPAGEIGEIVVKGPNIMQGYWKRADETQAIFRNGWMRTGDLGRMDADGFFYVVERAKDLIIAGGFNIYPREVEEVLFHHPAISEVAVAGAPDEYRGETVAAFVVLKPGYQASERMRENIIDFARKDLTPYKVPKIIEFRDSLPKSLIGKVLRRELHIQNGHE